MNSACPRVYPQGLQQLGTMYSRRKQNEKMSFGDSCRAQGIFIILGPPDTGPENRQEGVSVRMEQKSSGRTGPDAIRDPVPLFPLHHP